MLHLIFPLYARNSTEMCHVPEIVAGRSEDGSVTWNTLSFNFECHIRCFRIEEEFTDPFGNVRSMLHTEVPVTRHDLTLGLPLCLKDTNYEFSAYLAHDTLARVGYNDYTSQVSASFAQRTQTSLGFIPDKKLFRSTHQP